MDRLCQLSQSTRLDRIFPVFEMSYCALGNFRLARQELRGKLFCSCSDFVQIFRVNYSFVFAEGFVCRVQGSRVRKHGHIGTTGPARGRLFADVMEFACDDVPARQQADCSACTWFAVRSAKLALGSRQDAIDFIFHRPERKPARRLSNFDEFLS
jgi:hypothetical protein